MGEKHSGQEQHVQRPCAAGGMRTGEVDAGQRQQSLRGPGFHLTGCRGHLKC